MGRNVFVSMAKLSNVSGRIGYIGSESRQEHLYAIYTTEPDLEFWQELAAYNHEEFEKSGTGGKCIEARELVIALPESFIHYDHDRLLYSRHITEYRTGGRRNKTADQREICPD